MLLNRYVIITYHIKLLIIQRIHDKTFDYINKTASLRFLAQDLAEVEPETLQPLFNIDRYGIFFISVMLCYVVTWSITKTRVLRLAIFSSKSFVDLVLGEMIVPML